MADGVIIRRVQAGIVLPVRHLVLWPDKPAGFVQLDGDASAVHLAAFTAGHTGPVSVLSLFPGEARWQFRKFATLPAFSGKGIGTLLLEAAREEAVRGGAGVLWCDARLESAGFYERRGFIRTGQPFTKNGLLYVVMERQLTT